MEKTYEVKGMTCVICKNNVEKTVDHLPGVQASKVNLLENELTIRYDETIISESAIAQAIKKAGYTMVIDKEKHFDKEKIHLIISLILTAAIMYFSMGHMIGLPALLSHHQNVIAQLLLTLLIIIINIHYYQSALTAIKNRCLNMDVLVSISTLSAFFYSLYATLMIFKETQNYHIYYETSAMILSLVTLGKYIEGSARNKTNKVLRGLSTLIPMQTTVLIDNEKKVIPSSELKKGDICLIAPGESIPQDGIVIKGEASIDESLITGESLPKQVQKDDEVIGGTINLDGVIEIRIAKRANQTILANIINLTKQVSEQKIPVERFADTVSRYFVIAVIIIAVITFAIWLFISKNIETALNYALCVLVISCPCALGLATPSAIAVANGVAARNGILIKNPAILETAGRLKTIIFDKTGTLSENQLIVSKVISNNEFLAKVALSLEKDSNHPIAKAISSHFAGNESLEFTSLKEISGEGVEAHCQNDSYYAGNQRLLNRITINADDEVLKTAQEENATLITVVKNQEILGYIFLKDALRKESISAIKQLKKVGIEPLMCTGDNYHTAKALANEVGIATFYAEVKPEDKEELVRNRKEKGLVAMVGDGVNDAIALSGADVSFTIASGSDIASASSDVILLKNDLNDLVFTYQLAKKTMRVIVQNLFWALFYNAIFIPVAAGALTPFGVSFNPMFGAFAMSISSLFVLYNSLRINKIKKEEQ